MTRIKLCGLSRSCDMEAANLLQPEYIGFVFAPKSKRYITPKEAEKLKHLLIPVIKAVGVFVNEEVETVARLLNDSVIDLAQLHGKEDKEYIQQLRKLTNKPIIQAFRIETANDIANVEHSIADYVLLDSGAGTGMVFDWNLIKSIKRPFFLAGGLEVRNVNEAIQVLHPFAVDVSSGIEINGQKDKTKMAAFVDAVRKEDRL